MRKAIGFFVFFGVWPASVIGGFVFGIEGAANLARFIAWALMLPAGFIMLSETVIKEVAKETPSNAILSGCRIIMQAGCLGVLVWFGAWITGIAYAAHVLMNAAARSMVRQERAKASQPST